MNFRIVFYLLLIFSFVVVQGKSQHQSLDKSSFYSAMASENIEEIDAQLSIVKGSLTSEKEACEGALLMKKAGMVTKARDKLSLFKSGRSKLELSIARNNENIEFRFLRLIIQEHAPKIVNYRNDLVSDSQLIRTNFKSLSHVVQQAIIDYSKKSRLLKPSYF